MHVSAADQKRHWEVFRGETKDAGRSWRFEPVTRDSAFDNLRPIVPRTAQSNEVLLWLRGSYRSYTDYSLEAVGLLPPPAAARDVAE